MKTLRKVFPVLLALLLTLTLVPASLAQVGTPKEETVYALLHSDGTPDELYVVNSFELQQPGTIVDFGKYATVRNLTTSETLQTQNGYIQANAPAGRFYYEGKLDSKALPWAIRISYFLDGKSIAADRLAGKSGTLLIRIDVKQNKSENAPPRVFFENQALQVSLALDAQLCREISAPKATLANAGKNKLITFVLLPGTEKSFAVNAKVSHFEMDGIALNGTAMGIDFELDNNTQAQLTDGFSALSDGVSKLNSAVLTLKDGSADYRAGIRTFAKQTSALTGASSQVYAGLRLSSQGMSSMVQLSAELKPVAEALQESLDPRVQALAKGFLAQQEALGKLSRGLNGIAQQYKKMDGGISQVSAAAKKLSSGYEGLHNGVGKLSEGTTELKNKTSTLNKDVQSKLDEMIKELSHSDYKPVSFVSAENKDVRLVQFVMRTSPIALPEKKRVEEERQESQSFLQRLTALFSPEEE